jgi:precorrin-3B C17-methyltransferase
MSGWVRIVGLGAGATNWLTPEANEILHQATDIVGYETYVAVVPATVNAKRHASDNGVEIARAEYALSLAASGAKVAVVSGGDAGVFGMASAVFEAVENGDASWRELDIVVIPAMTALLAVAARVGAPLGHDFCVISLSTYLKPWEIIKQRLQAAIAGDFVLVIYNPASKTRREDLHNALDLLNKLRGSNIIAIIATNVGRMEEKITITTVGELDPSLVTMQTMLLIGSTHTRLIECKNKEPLVFTPRFYEMPS